MATAVPVDPESPAVVFLDPPAEDERFARTEYAVEATTFEQIVLCRDNWEGRSDPRLPWEWHGNAVWLELGRVGGNGVIIAFTWATINGHLVMFWTHTAFMLDFLMVRRWLSRHCPEVHLRSGRALFFEDCLAYCRGQRFPAWKGA